MQRRENMRCWVTFLNLSKLSREEGRGPGTPADLQIRKWFAEILNMGGLHGEGGGAEDLLVLHLVVGQEQAGGRL